MSLPAGPITRERVERRPLRRRKTINSDPRRLSGTPDVGVDTFIYFVRAGEFVKIGQSRNWKDRIATIQTGSPYTVVPLLVLKDHPYLERKLHNRFRNDRFRAEWFHFSPAIREFIKENLAFCQTLAEVDDLRSKPETAEDVAIDL